MSSFISEEKDKSKRKLNLIVHNAPESSDEQGAIRKHHDTTYTTDVLQKYLGIGTKIEKAFRLGRRGEKPRLLKITVASEHDKVAILRNCTKLRNIENPENVRQLYITPDLTPAEQEINRKLCAREELREESRRESILDKKLGHIIKKPTK